MNKENFENSLNKLKEFSEKIKAQDTTLEDALICYEEGMKYYRKCDDFLCNAKQTIETFESEE